VNLPETEIALVGDVADATGMVRLQAGVGPEGVRLRRYTVRPIGGNLAARHRAVQQVSDAGNSPGVATVVRSPLLHTRHSHHRQFFIQPLTCQFSNIIDSQFYILPSVFSRRLSDSRREIVFGRVTLLVCLQHYEKMVNPSPYSLVSVGSFFRI